MSGPWLRTRAPIQAGFLLLLGVLVGLQLSDSELGLLILAPGLLLLGALSFGRYPGERLLEVVVRAWHPASRPERRPPAQPLLAFPSFPRGGVLLARALAGRGPPG